VLRIVFLVLLASPVAIAQAPTHSPASQAPKTATAASSADPVGDAESAIVKSDWKAAQDKLDLWLSRHPDDSRALFDAGYVADAQNRPDDAVALYRRALKTNPKSFESHLSLGLLLARLGKPEEARAELAAATQLDPGDAGPAMKARAWRALALIDQPGLSNPSDTTLASNDLLEALKLTPETPIDTLLAANLADRAGEFDAAEKAYRRVLARDPKSAPANAGLAHILIVRKQYPEAETFLRAALNQAPDDPALTAQLATVLAAQDKAEALPLIQKLHDSHPADAAITLMLAEVLAEAGDAVGSDHLYIGLLAKSPADPALLIGHGQNLIHQLKYADAFSVFDKATQLEPANADGWSGLAYAASHTNQPAVTLHALTMRSKLLPEVPSTYFLWATAYDTLHQKAQAVAYYHQFLDSSAGKFPDQEWQARQRIILLEKKP
jgi:tetratricopeptide (TPR) repeat protein